MKPVAIVESCYKDKFGTPRQPGLAPSSQAWIQFTPEVQPELSLQGLEGFSHLWVIFLFHLNKSARFHAKVHPPRLNGKTMGLFATRSPHRPNPIGLSLVKIEKIEGSRILVSGVDLVDGTPVLDVKPYLPGVEALENASSGWLDEIENAQPELDASSAPVEEGGSSVQVTFSCAAEETLEALSLRMKFDFDQRRKLIIETIGLDPRPVIYKGFEQTESKYRDTHAVRLYDIDVHFRFHSETLAEVFAIKII